MLIDIEIISGRVLDLLDDKGKLSFDAIKDNLHESDELVMQSLQWLILTEFITEDRLTKEYAINDLQGVSKEAGPMRGITSKD